jgi:hypothetical protein
LYQCSIKIEIIDPVNEKYLFQINYKTENIEEKLKEYCGNSVNCYFDNVGGTMSELIIGNMVENSNVVLCGQISSYNNKAIYPNVLSEKIQKVSNDTFFREKIKAAVNRKLVGVLSFRMYFLKNLVTRKLPITENLFRKYTTVYIISLIHTFVNIPALLLKNTLLGLNQGRDINKSVSRGYYARELGEKHKLNILRVLKLLTFGYFPLCLYINF